MNTGEVIGNFLILSKLCDILLPILISLILLYLTDRDEVSPMVLKKE